MTEPDEETKEQPTFPESIPPAEPELPPPPIDTTGMSPPGPIYQPPATYPQPPTPGWPGQPPMPPQGYPPQPPGQWQGPGYGASPPGYGPPGYGSAPGWAASQPWGAAAPVFKTSVLAVLAGALLIIFGVLLIVLGAWTLTQGRELGDLLTQLRSVDLLVFQPTRDQLQTSFSLLPAVLMVFGLLQLLIGTIILAHRGWARWLGVLLALIGLLFSAIALFAAMSLVPGTSVQAIIAAVLLLGYAFVLLALIAGGGHFRARYPGR